MRRQRAPRPTEWFYFERGPHGLALRTQFPPRPPDARPGTGAAPWYQENDHWDEEHVHVRGGDEKDARKRAKRLMTVWFVYVLQSLAPRYGKRGQVLPGFYYVGSTTDVARRVAEHNGIKPGGAKWTAKHRPHELRAVFGPYYGQSEALKAERALKHGLRGTARTQWAPTDSKWCRGLGTDDPRIPEINRVVQGELDARSRDG